MRSVIKTIAIYNKDQKKLAELRKDNNLFVLSEFVRYCLTKDDIINEYLEKAKSGLKF